MSGHNNLITVQSNATDIIVLTTTEQLTTLVNNQTIGINGKLIDITFEDQKITCKFYVPLIKSVLIMSTLSQTNLIPLIKETHSLDDAKRILMGLMGRTFKVTAVVVKKEINNIMRTYFNFINLELN